MPDNLDLVDDLNDAAIDAWYRLRVAVQVIQGVLEHPERACSGSDLAIVREIIEGVRAQLRVSLRNDGDDLSDDACWSHDRPGAVQR
jgi:hypothetical protein